jgi:hypothetical protein
MDHVREIPGLREDYGLYSIVDGKECITAVMDYLGNVFALKGLEEFAELNGARFGDLPRRLQAHLVYVGIYR